MGQSSSVAALAKALALAQPHIKEPEKDSRANYGEYASLNSVRRAILPPLNAQGIAVVQLVGSDEHGDSVETTFLHTSGEWISTKANLKIEKPTMQGMGSAITYLSRYQLQAMAGVGGIDDDGDAAEDFPKGEKKTHDQPHRPPSGEKKKITPGQIGLFHAKTKGWDQGSLKSLLEGFHVDRPEDLLMANFNSVLEAIEELKRS